MIFTSFAQINQLIKSGAYAEMEALDFNNDKSEENMLITI
jgi:hypothetical protein